MYALINTMSSTDTCYGHIISRHRTIGAAVRADHTLQRQTRAGCGQSSYLPTIIAEGRGAGRYAARSDWSEVDACGWVADEDG